MKKEGLLKSMMKQEKLLASNEKFISYVKGKDLYLANAKKMADRGKTDKASEFLWGACTQLLHAFAYSKQITLPGHKETVEFVRALSVETNDKELFALFKKAEKLHANFYHHFLDPEEFQEYYKYAERFIQKIEEIMKKNLKISADSA